VANIELGNATIALAAPEPLGETECMDEQLREDYADQPPPDFDDPRSTQSIVTGAIVLMCAAFLFPCLLGLFLHLWTGGWIG
jgi:hypothetical protein